MVDLGSFLSSDEDLYKKEPLKSNLYVPNLLTIALHQKFT